MDFMVPHIVVFFFPPKMRLVQTEKIKSMASNFNIVDLEFIICSVKCVLPSRNCSINFFCFTTAKKCCPNFYFLI